DGAVLPESLGQQKQVAAEDGLAPALQIGGKAETLQEVILAGDGGSASAPAGLGVHEDHAVVRLDEAAEGGEAFGHGVLVFAATGDHDGAGAIRVAVSAGLAGAVDAPWHDADEPPGRCPGDEPLDRL